VKNKLFLFTLLGIMVVLLTVTFVIDRPGSTAEEQEMVTGSVGSGSVSVNSQAPVFSLPDPTGVMIKLDDYLGKIIVLNFWATWCEPCHEEMPVLDEYNTQYSESVIILGIAVNASLESTISFLQETPVDYPILIDKNGVVAAAYHVAGYPTTYFIDAKGIIRGKFVGLITPRILQQNLTPLGITK
jgi:thiol-disulfide isomerase/thioredoxin